MIEPDVSVLARLLRLRKDVCKDVIDTNIRPRTRMTNAVSFSLSFRGTLKLVTVFEIATRLTDRSGWRVTTVR